MLVCLKSGWQACSALIVRFNHSAVQLPFPAHLGRREQNRDAGRGEVEAMLFLKEDKNANKEGKRLFFLHLLNRGRYMTVP